MRREDSEQTEYFLAALLVVKNDPPYLPTAGRLKENGSWQKIGNHISCQTRHS
jgi:hypothetical protein